MEKITLRTIGGGNERNSGSSSEQITAHNTSDTAHAAIRELFKSGASASEIKAALAELGENYKDLYTLANTLKTFLESHDTADDTINTWREIEDFLNGLTDRDSLTGLMEQEHQKLKADFEGKLEIIQDQATDAQETANLVYNTMRVLDKKADTAQASADEVHDLALNLAGAQVSNQKVVPYIRKVTAEQFITGNYPFATPDGWTPTPYTLPMLEPVAVSAGDDTITAMQPVTIYEIGNLAGTDAEGNPVAADLVGPDTPDGGSFPLFIPTTSYNIDGTAVPALAEGQTVIVRIHKTKGARIHWANDSGTDTKSNIYQYGGLCKVQQRKVQTVSFAVTRKDGQNVVTQIFEPDFYHKNFGDSPLAQYSSMRDAFDAILSGIEEVNNKATEAQEAANDAKNLAADAHTAAGAALGNVEGFNSRITAAQSTADAADTLASEAYDYASDANNSAFAAQKTADAAKDAAEESTAKANTAVLAANEAKTMSAAAQTTATAAQTTAVAAQETVTGAENEVKTIKSFVGFQHPYAIPTTAVIPISWLSDEYIVVKSSTAQVNATLVSVEPPDDLLGYADVEAEDEWKDAQPTIILGFTAIARKGTSNYRSLLTIYVPYQNGLSIKNPVLSTDGVSDTLPKFLYMDFVSKELVDTLSDGSKVYHYTINVTISPQSYPDLEALIYPIFAKKLYMTY